MRTASVRALQRGLIVLEHFNRRDGSTITDVMRVLDAPYATTYRLLKTLCHLGLLTKGNRRGEYWLAARVKSLSSGYRGERWIAQYAAKVLDDLAEQAQWPAFLLLPRGEKMVVRARSTSSSPLIKSEIPTGSAADMTETAAGLAYMAFGRERAAGPPKALQRKLAHVRKVGFSEMAESERSILQVAVPLFVSGKPRGALMLRANKRAVPGVGSTERWAQMMNVAAAQLALHLPDGDAKEA